MVDWQLAKPIASAQECKRWLEGSKELVLAQVTAALETNTKLLQQEGTLINLQVLNMALGGNSLISIPNCQFETGPV